MKRGFLPALSLFMGACCLASGSGMFFTQQNVFLSGEEGYNTLRVPSILMTKEGTLLAFCEGRSSWRDKIHIDLVMKRSEDRGQTWSSLVCLVKAMPKAAMNPTPVQDRTTGRIFVVYELFPENYDSSRRGLGSDSATDWMIASDDDGRSWTRPIEITSMTKKPEWGTIAHGPGVGIQTQSGRLMIPSNCGAEDGSYAYVIYSDDHGKTWQIGGQAGPHMDEAQVVELAGGDLRMNMRSYRKQGCRAIAYSSDGGLTWTEPADEPQLPCPVCQASILRYTRTADSDKNRLLFCNPADASKRINLTVRISYDEGKTWPVSRLICSRASGYSCLVVLDDGTIGVLYETSTDALFTRDRGTRPPGWMNLAFARFNLEWLTEGRDRLEQCSGTDQ